MMAPSLASAYAPAGYPYSPASSGTGSSSPNESRKVDPLAVLSGLGGAFSGAAYGLGYSSAPAEEAMDWTPWLLALGVVGLVYAMTRK